MKWSSVLKKIVLSREILIIMDKQKVYTVLNIRNLI